MTKPHEHIAEVRAILTKAREHYAGVSDNLGFIRAQSDIGFTELDTALELLKGWPIVPDKVTPDGN